MRDSFVWYTKHVGGYTLHIMDVLEDCRVISSTSIIGPYGVMSVHDQNTWLVSIARDCMDDFNTLETNQQVMDFIFEQVEE